MKHQATDSAIPELHEFQSPLPLEGAPCNCVELTIYDDDGPEGYYKRLRFSRSADAMRHLMHWFEPDELADYNFELRNYWNK